MSVLQQIAQEVGVSSRTVQNVLSGRNKENWESTALRAAQIRDLATKLGYQPNGAAKATATGRFGCVALLMSTNPLFSHLPALLLKGIHDELARSNRHLSLFQMPDEQLQDAKKMPKILREWMADGMIVDYTHNIPAPLIELIETHRLPAVWFNTLRDFDCVRPDDYGAGRQAAKHLWELGHRRIAYLNSSHDWPALQNRGTLALGHYSAHDRYQGICDELAKHKCEPIGDVGWIPLTAEGAKNRAARLRTLLETERPTAVISASGQDCKAALWVARDLNLAVPEQLSIFNFSETAGEIIGLGQHVSSVFLPSENMGNELVQMLSQKIESPSQKIPARVLPFGFDAGATCAPVSQEN